MMPYTWYRDDVVVEESRLLARAGVGPACGPIYVYMYVCMYLVYSPKRTELE
jgi:hypothetical protein